MVITLLFTVGVAVQFTSANMVTETTSLLIKFGMVTTAADGIPRLVPFNFQSYVGFNPAFEGVAVNSANSPSQILF